MQQPLQLLDNKLIVRYKVLKRGESYPKGLKFTFLSAFDDDETEAEEEDDEDFEGDCEDRKF